VPSSVATTFPAARLDRSESAQPLDASSSIGTPTSSAPRTRIMPFAFRETSGLCVVVSELMSGPAIIDMIAFQHDQAGGGRFPTFAIYKSLDGSGAGNDLPITTIPSGTRLFDNLQRQREDGFPAADNLGIPSFTLASTAGWWIWPLGILVTDPQFFVKLRCNENDAAVYAMQGYLRVVEGISDAVIRNFR
jgi:hypothetical protein